MGTKVGKQTIKFQNPPVIISTASLVGSKEGKGPLRNYFDQVIEDNMFKEPTPEKAESHFLREATRMAIEKAKLTNEDIDYFLAGDLLNQIISSSFAARELNIPYIGLFGACSTIAEALALGGVIIDGGFATNIAAAASSHYQSAERQFRYPIELNIQRKVTSQRTVTGAGAFMLAKEGKGPKTTYATIGKVVDMGIKDPNDMGAAMAPAAADTVSLHFKETGRCQAYYDLILTGDLANIGKPLFIELMKKNGYEMGDNYNDGGVMIFSEEQGVQAGGSGCGCLAAVTCGYIYDQLLKGNMSKVLIIGTGALLNPLTFQQGETIPCVAHAVSIEMQ